VIATDASDKAIGAILMQDHGATSTGCIRIPKLWAAELNYAVHEKEALAVVHACSRATLGVTYCAPRACLLVPKDRHSAQR
jgi:hypothetical protein